MPYAYVTEQGAVDRFVLRAVNLGRYRSGDFRCVGSNGVRLREGGLKTLLADYEHAMQKPATAAPHTPVRTWRETIRDDVERFATSLPGSTADLSATTTVPKETACRMPD